ncbi:hypothetical protein M3Y99_00932300 [Aphelenchoides fujianensis]|nr:hypothetical protein M3Y99_00932300 [Aphelenchoides fujianensis]
MKTTTLVVLLLSCFPLFSCVPLSSKGFTISGVVQKRNAAQLAEYRRQQRASPLYSKNFLLDYPFPDESLLANVTIYSSDQKTHTTYTLSFETATDWMYIFDSSLTNPANSASGPGSL